MKTYKAVYQGGSGEIVEKKSRFIAHVASVSTVEEAQQFIDRIKKEYWDARHNCSAFSVGDQTPLTRSSDDGEPSGTAGKPILEVILGSGIHNIVIVVTRYFGGTLLGTGGLVRAYTEAAREGIKNSVIIEKIPGVKMRLRTDYTDLGKIQYILAQNNVSTVDTEYTDQVALTALFAQDEEDRIKKLLTEATSGRVVMEELCELYFASADGEILTFPL
ncbi:MAG: YigZ family protein [Eubacterium sp.]|nr:YigZ family protein [Eubacterium sp.]